MTERTEPSTYLCFQPPVLDERFFIANVTELVDGKFITYATVCERVYRRD